MVRLDSRALFFVIVTLSLVSPAVVFLLVGLALCGQIGLVLLSVLASATTSGQPSDGRPSHARGPARFSVHIATYCEPAPLVTRTLLALSEQTDAPEFEVIVLDNNTADSAQWRPVQELCQRLGRRFRFFHEDNVAGAKAGALNIALARTDPEATHVVVLDADYEASPGFLALAAEEIARSDDDFIQFPQAYRNTAEPARGISLELADYFLRHARQADGAGAMLLTGTLSVIRRDALVEAGGWNDKTLTEDAELGLRLRRRGYRGRFVDRVVGRGIMPLDMSGLASQRYRWASGNVRTAMKGFSGLSLRSALHVLSQLTAWANFGLPLSAGLIGGGLALSLGFQGDSVRPMISFSGVGILLVYLSSTLPLFVSTARREGANRPTILAALAARVSLLAPSALGTIDALLGLQRGFRRTPKDGCEASKGVGAVLPAMAVGGVLLLLVPGLPISGLVGGALLALPYPLSLSTQARLAAYRASLRAS
ncbi:glycosyltransferase family 2 protein [Salipiger profundus]|uniref:glycosyltransferase family 2 protein n=1 Tax=Salipiger profundus TaxID=1229727 RepID=UPI0008F41541|nr:glycosyltransferase family 2 protein [Salipiger profundus]SFD78027.1 Glycosyltransferase, catalytic subunit of cellulose synthase and poly-beta-1,6-N-acetylglucosamine synthase [Salipiger profundus]